MWATRRLKFRNWWKERCRSTGSPSFHPGPPVRKNSAACSKRPWWRGEALTFRTALPALQQDRANDDHALDHLLGIARYIHEVHAVADDSQNQHAQEGLQGGALAARQAGSPNYHRGDGIQFRARS